MKKKLRLLEVIYSYDVGGSERLASIIAQTAKKRGYQVAVCALKGSDGSVRKELEKNGIQCFSAGEQTSSAIKIMSTLFFLFLRFRPDILHVHHVTQLILSYWPAKFVRVPKIILTEHANYSIKKKNRLQKRAKKYCKKADNMTTVNNELKHYFNEEIGVPVERLITIPNGVDTQQYKPAPPKTSLIEEFDLQDTKFILCCVGRLVEAKDHANLLKAIKLVVNKGITDFTLLIVGDGALRGELERETLELGITDNVIFTGARNDIEDILRVSNVCVLSSRREGFPMVLLEAMSTGVPCISTNVGCVNELITQEVGIIVPSEDSEALANAIANLNSRIYDLEEMGAKARKIIIEKYDINDVLTHYLNVLVDDNQLG